MHVLGDFAQLLRRLNRQLPCGAQNNCLQLLKLRINFLQSGNPEGRRLACPGLSLPDNILPVQQIGNRLFLNGRKLHKAHLPDGADNTLVQHTLKRLQDAFLLRALLV